MPFRSWELAAGRQMQSSSHFIIKTPATRSLNSIYVWARTAPRHLPAFDLNAEQLLYIRYQCDPRVPATTQNKFNKCCYSQLTVQGLCVENTSAVASSMWSVVLVRCSVVMKTKKSLCFDTTSNKKRLRRRRSRRRRRSSIRIWIIVQTNRTNWICLLLESQGRGDSICSKSPEGWFFVCSSHISSNRMGELRGRSYIYYINQTMCAAIWNLKFKSNRKYIKMQF